jgi:transcriptional regulator with XRE-family HTH domain
MKKPPDVCRLLGQRLRALRKQKELTQEEAGERAGVNPRYYAEVERGQRNISVGSLQKIADGLGVNLEDIFRFSVNRALTEDEEKIVALVTRVIAKGNKKSNRRIRNVLQEIV